MNAFFTLLKRLFTTTMVWVGIIVLVCLWFGGHLFYYKMIKPAQNESDPVAMREKAVDKAKIEAQTKVDKAQIEAQAKVDMDVAKAKATEAEFKAKEAEANVKIAEANARTQALEAQLRGRNAVDQALANEINGIQSVFASSMKHPVTPPPKEWDLLKDGDNGQYCVAYMFPKHDDRDLFRSHPVEVTEPGGRIYTTYLGHRGLPSEGIVTYIKSPDDKTLFYGSNDPDSNVQYSWVGNGYNIQGGRKATPDDNHFKGPVGKCIDGVWFSGRPGVDPYGWILQIQLRENLTGKLIKDSSKDDDLGESYIAVWPYKGSTALPAIVAKPDHRVLTDPWYK